MKVICYFSDLSKFLFIFAVMASFGLVGGCSSSSGGSSTPADANPDGYYTGTATLKDGSSSDTNVSDLQAIVKGNRILLMSNTPSLPLVYDITITNIDVNDFTADVAIYSDIETTTPLSTPIVVTNTTISGVITEGSKITGTIAGTGLGSGNFTLTYSLQNGTDETIADLTGTWSGPINTVVQGNSFDFKILSNGTINFDVLAAPVAGLFENCDMQGTVTEVANSPVFSFEVATADKNCFVTELQNSTLTGLMAIKDANKSSIVIIFTNSAYAGMGIWDRQ